MITSNLNSQLLSSKNIEGEICFTRDKKIISCELFLIRKLKIDWSQRWLYNTFHYKTQLQNIFCTIVVFITIIRTKESSSFVLSSLQKKTPGKHIFIMFTHTTPSKGFLYFFSFTFEWTFLCNFVISLKKIGVWVRSSDEKARSSENLPLNLFR